MARRPWASLCQAARWLKRAGVHKSWVRAHGLDCQINGGWWTLRWDTRGDLSVVPPTWTRPDYWTRAVPRDLTCMQNLCGAEGLRSDLRAHVCSCRHGNTDGWAVRHGNSNLAACRLKIRPSQDLSPGTPSRQRQKRRGQIPLLVLRLLPEERKRRWPANQSVRPPRLLQTKTDPSKLLWF